MGASSGMCSTGRAGVVPHRLPGCIGCCTGSWVVGPSAAPGWSCGWPVPVMYSVGCRRGGLIGGGRGCRSTAMCVMWGIRVGHGGHGGTSRGASVLGVPRRARGDRVGIAGNSLRGAAAAGDIWLAVKETGEGVGGVAVSKDPRMSPNWGPKTVPRVWTSDDEDDQAQRYQTVAACSVLKRFAATPQQAREVLDMLGLRTSVGSARVALIDEPDFPAYARPSSVQPPKTRPCAVPLLPDGWDPQAKHWYLMMCDIIGRDGIFPIAWRAATMDWARESFGEWIKR